MYDFGGFYDNKFIINFYFFLYYGGAMGFIRVNFFSFLYPMYVFKRTISHKHVFFAIGMNILTPQSN